MRVSYSPTFIRLFNKLPQDLQTEVIEKVELFKEITNHTSLKVHKLSGRLQGKFSFSVNYKTRIVFVYLKTKPKEAFLLAIGDHDVYNR